MKKVVLIVFCILFLASVSWAEQQQFVQYETVTSSHLITTGKGLYHGIKVNTDGTNAQTIIVCDDVTAACGTTIDPSTVYVTSSTMRVQASGSNPPRPYYNGLYISISGSGTVSVTVEFTPL